MIENGGYNEMSRFRLNERLGNGWERQGYFDMESRHCRGTHTINAANVGSMDMEMSNLAKNPT